MLPKDIIMIKNIKKETTVTLTIFTYCISLFMRLSAYETRLCNPGGHWKKRILILIIATDSIGTFALHSSLYFGRKIFDHEKKVNIKIEQ